MAVIASTRRAALGAILAAPISGVAVAATPPGSSSSLQTLVRRYSHFHAQLIAEGERLDNISGPKGHSNYGRLVVLCGRLRTRIALHPVQGLGDVLLKVKAYAVSTSADEGRQDLRCRLNRQGGHAYEDDVAAAATFDLMQLGGIGPCD